MNVCIIGDGLISLTLAKTLVNQGINVDIFSNQKLSNSSKSRTISISKNNLDFFNQEIINIEKLTWKVNKIYIFTKNLVGKKLLNFENKKKHLFSIVKNEDLYNFLKSALKKNKLFSLKKNLKINKYNLIINCDPNHNFSKKFFYKRIDKNYNSYAYTTIINHKKILNNDVAIQIFTNDGPLAFLPINSTQTSIVYSVNNLKNIDLKNLIKKFNSKYSIISIGKISKFKLKSSYLRSYYHNNILAFGEQLHKIHPLAGQGFNMTIRDIKELLRLIKSKINLGLELDKSICIEFEKKTKPKNYLFLNTIDFIYEFFNFESKMNNSFISRSVQLLGSNQKTNNFFKKVADEGIYF